MPFRRRPVLILTASKTAKTKKRQASQSTEREGTRRQASCNKDQGNTFGKRVFDEKTGKGKYVVVLTWNKNQPLQAGGHNPKQF